MSDRCPKCYARLGRCDCEDTDPEMVVDRVTMLEEKVERLEQQVSDMLEENQPKAYPP